MSQVFKKLKDGETQYLILFSKLQSTSRLQSESMSVTATLSLRSSVGSLSLFPPSKMSIYTRGVEESAQFERVPGSLVDMFEPVRS